MSLAWTERWPSRRPSFGSDEFYRHTLVLPWPFRIGTGGGGDAIFWALVLVVRPWWLCRAALDPEVRRYVRFERAYYRSLYTLWELDEPTGDADWNAHYDLWEPHRPPYPKRWRR